MKNNKIKILKKTLAALNKTTEVDPYKIERFKEQLRQAIIKEGGEQDGE